MLEMVARSPIDRLLAPSPKKLDKCVNHALFTQEFGQCQRCPVAVMPGWRCRSAQRRRYQAGASWRHDPTSRFRLPNRLRLRKSRPMNRRAAYGGLYRRRCRGTPHRFFDLDDGRHFFQVDLVHNAVARRNHVHIFKGGFVQLIKWKRSSLRRSSISRFCGRHRVVAAAFNGQRVIDDKLRLHHRIHFGRIAAFFSAIASRR